ncbi:MAG: DUF1294 domain-containing protein [Planctomycetota bacterium]|nr:DUF1294 domain-containing protein [Planctomycetota bacterium]MDA1162392.1 DUF1294 domain-containing protein [Planctomycetota bacterium]
MSQNAIVVCSVWFGVLSLVSVAVYGFDKRRAKLEGDRVPEKTLHILSLLGGWPGAIIGQKLFRHKTIKTRFRLVFWLTVVGNVVISVILYAAFQQFYTWLT